MNKLFSKIATLSVGLAMAIGVGVAVGSKEAKVVKADGTANFTLSSASSVTVDGVTASFAKGSGSNDPAWYAAGLRLYASNTITISSSDSITAITFNWEKQGSKAFATVTADVGSYTHPSNTGDGTWSGSSSSVVFTLGSSGQLQLNTFSVTYSGGGPSVTYTITYAANGGSGTMEPTTGSNPAIAECTFTAPSGMRFSKWNTQANGEGTDYAVGAKPGADLGLYAIWEVKPAASVFELFSGAFEEGDYILVDSSNSKAMQAAISSNRFASVTVEIDSTEHTIETNDESIVWHAEASGDYWTLYNSDAAKYAGSTASKNQGALLDSVTDNAKWTVTGSETTYEFENLARSSSSTDPNNKLIRYNPSTSSFACYASGTGAALSLYRLVESGKNMRVQDNNHNQGPINVTYGDTEEYKYLLGWDVEAGNALRSGCSWTVSKEGIIDWALNGETWVYYKPITVGSVTVTCSCEGYKSASIVVNVVPGTLESIAVTGSMTKTSYYVGEDWSHDGLVATGTYDSGYVADVSSEATWTYSAEKPLLPVTNLVVTASIGTVSGSSAVQHVTVSRTNPIQVLYTKADKTDVDVYGVYVGFLDGTGPVIMDGAYGMVCYNKTADVSGYTAGTTILHVTGTMGSYHGLRQVTSPVLSVASGTYDVPENPVVYATQGGETAEYASRLTTVTGVPSLYPDPDNPSKYGDFSADAGVIDIRMKFAVGEQEVVVFYKKDAQTADADAYAAMKDAVAGSSEITIKGFTGWYDGFQVQMNGYIPPAVGYTAEDFAQDLLDQTDAVCAGWEKGVNNHDALEAIWSNLASNDKYPSLPADQKNILAEAERDEGGTVVEQAMARYDFLTGKYSLSNFINGRTPIVPAGMMNYSDIIAGNNTIVIVIVIATASALAFTTLLVFKKKKQK